MAQNNLIKRFKDPVPTIWRYVQVLCGFISVVGGSIMASKPDVPLWLTLAVSISTGIVAFGAQFAIKKQSEKNEQSDI